MPYRLRYCDNNSLLVVHFYEAIIVEEFEALTKHLRSDGLFVPEMDRLIIIDEKTDMSELDPRALASIKDAMVRLEKSDLSDDSHALQFRSAYVVTVGMQEIIAKLYAANWDADILHQPQLHMFATVPDALAWLGRRDLE